MASGEHSLWSMPDHRDWLTHHLRGIVQSFQQHIVDPDGGFYHLDRAFLPVPDPTRDVVSTSRLVYVFSRTSQMNLSGCNRIVDHGLDYLWNHLRDLAHGGYWWELPKSRNDLFPKKAYGHAFVLLAAAAAAAIGHPLGQNLTDDVLSILDEKFWSLEDELYRDEFSKDWGSCSSYRGQNSNMHLVEALLFAGQTQGSDSLIDRAVRVARRLIDEITRANDWRLAEHYTRQWAIDPSFNRDVPDDPYRPHGSLIGHWLEWSRLLMNLRELRPEEAWLLSASETLFAQAAAEGWAAQGGFIYAVDFSGRPLNEKRYWWCHAEAIAAAATLYSATENEHYLMWYRKFWDFIDTHFIDRDYGGWHAVLDAENRISEDGPWTGKPDLYHIFQALCVGLRSL